MSTILDTNLNLLVAFDALLSEGNVTRAARRIGLSQPAMSRVLSQLREVFADPLFVRSPGGVEPTRRALELSEPVRQGLEAFNRALAPVSEFDPERSHGTFTLAMSDYAELIVLPPLLRRISERAPDIELHVRSWAFDASVAQLSTGDVDVMVGFSRARSLPKGHSSRELFQDPFVCIVRKGHPRVRSRLTLKTYLALSHIIVREGRASLGAGDAALAELGHRRRIGARVPSFLVVPQLVATTDMVAAIDSRIARHFERSLAIRIFAPPIPLPVERTSMVWRSRDTEHPAQAWLREQILDVSKELESQFSVRQ